MITWIIVISILVIALLIAVAYLLKRKPDVDIDKFEDGIAWYDREGNMINSTSIKAKKRK